jgi:hypothetical protein
MTDVIQSDITYRTNNGRKTWFENFNAEAFNEIIIIYTCVHSQTSKLHQALTFRSTPTVCLYFSVHS